MDPKQDIEMEVAQLCREDIYTDNRVGTIRVLTPVRADGSIDASRPIQFLGSTQILTPAGALPLNFLIEALTLEAAVAGFGKAGALAVEQTMEELKELQRQAASQIVVPKSGMGPGGLGGMGGMGGMGGGKIKLP